MSAQIAEQWLSKFNVRQTHLEVSVTFFVYLFVYFSRSGAGPVNLHF